MSDERKPLEPSLALLDRIDDAMGRYAELREYEDIEGARLKCTDAFALIRDYVLEAAAKACEGIMDAANTSAAEARGDRWYEKATHEECQANGAANCYAAIRAMKGSK